jgi:dTDP-4-amino-4,6-dideoxygalactose transaminase
VCNGTGQTAAAKPGESDLSDEVRLILPVAYPHNSHIWNQYTVRVLGQGQRDALRRFLADRGIGSEVYYPVPLHRQKCFLPTHGNAPTLPVCEAISAECLSLPIYPELSHQQLDDVVNGVAAFLEKTAEVAVKV